MSKNDTGNNWMKVCIGYGYIVLPVEEACAMMRCMTTAKKYEVRYTDGRPRPYIGGDLPSFGMELLVAGQYVEGIVNGPYEEKKDDTAA